MYDVKLSPGYVLTTTLNGVLRSAVALQVAPVVGSSTVQYSSSYEIMNVNFALAHQRWRTTLYLTNIFDKQEILAPPSQPNEINNLTNDYQVNTPRVIGLRVGYSFD
jgi:hypothetical protein